MHVGAVLDSERIRVRLLARATGFQEKMILPLIVNCVPLSKQHLSAIERHRGLIPGALNQFEGVTLDELWRQELLYGEVRVKTSAGGEAVVAAPFLTALAGFVLAGEALKYSAGDAYRPHRLGVHGNLPTRYAESPWGSPFDAQLIDHQRWPGHECLCGGRRLALVRERYSLE
jgi:hypothetical protein